MFIITRTNQPELVLHQHINPYVWRELRRPLNDLEPIRFNSIFLAENFLRAAKIKGATIKLEGDPPPRTT